MKSSKPLRGFTGSRRYTLPGALPLPHPVTAALAAACEELEKAGTRIKHIGGSSAQEIRVL